MSIASNNPKKKKERKRAVILIWFAFDWNSKHMGGKNLQAQSCQGALSLLLNCGCFFFFFLLFCFFRKNMNGGYLLACEYRVRVAIHVPLRTFSRTRSPDAVDTTELHLGALSSSCIVPLKKKKKKKMMQGHALGCCDQGRLWTVLADGLVVGWLVVFNWPVGLGVWWFLEKGGEMSLAEWDKGMML